MVMVKDCWEVENASMKDLFGITKFLLISGYDVHSAKNMKEILNKNVLLSEVQLDSTWRYEGKEFVQFKALDILNPSRIYYVRSYSQSVIDIFKMMFKSGLTFDDTIPCKFTKHCGCTYMNNVDDDVLPILKKSYNYVEREVSKDILEDMHKKLIEDSLYKSITTNLDNLRDIEAAQLKCDEE